MAAKVKWTIPTVLTVQALALGCPDRENVESGSEDAETVASESSGPPVDCPAIAVEAECDANAQCAFFPEHGGCVRDCAGLPENECNALGHCAWYESFCDYAPVA